MQAMPTLHASAASQTNEASEADETNEAAGTQAMLARARLLGPATGCSTRSRCVPLVRGEGVWLVDAHGRRYLDAYNNVAAVGHCHPHVVAAIARQAATLNTHTRYLHDGILDYAERLLGTMPAALGHLMLTCTGSEADLALRIAAAHTGGNGLHHPLRLSRRHRRAGRGSSLGAQVRLGSHVRTVPARPIRACRRSRSAPAFARGVRAAIAELQASGLRPAALLVDTVFSSDGILTDPPGFLAEAVDAMRAAGGLFIADEVQPGLGRTGEAMWASCATAWCPTW